MLLVVNLKKKLSIMRPEYLEHDSHKSKMDSNFFFLSTRAILRLIEAAIIIETRRKIEREQDDRVIERLIGSAGAGTLFD